MTRTRTSLKAQRVAAVRQEIARMHEIYGRAATLDGIRDDLADTLTGAQFTAFVAGLIRAATADFGDRTFEESLAHWSTPPPRPRRPPKPLPQ